MSFPPSFLEELRARLPLSEVVGKRMRLIRAGREHKGCCPFHNEKSPSFYVNDDKQFFHCFGCGAHGDVIGFAMRHDRLSFPEAIEALAGQAGLQVPRDTPIEREKFDQEKRLYLLLERAAAYFEEQLFAPQGREALAYLRQRGLNDGAIRRHRLGYAPPDGQSLLRALTMKATHAAQQETFTLDELATVGLAKKAEDRPEHYSFFRNRVMFPVGDRRGRTVAFGARVMGQGEPKYLNSPDHPLFHKGKLLYGLSRARAALSQGQSFIVVEGYMDAIALAEAGYIGAVAPLGTALTEDQIAALWRLLPSAETREPGRDYSPILCFDGDNAGLRAATRTVDRVLPLLSPEQTIRIATMAGAKDPDELLRTSGKAAMDLILKQSRPMIDVIWDLALAGRSLRTPEERGAFIGTLRRQTQRIAHESLRQLYDDEIRKRVAAFLKPQQRAGANGMAGGVPTASWNRPTYGKGRAGGVATSSSAFAVPLITRRQPPNVQRRMERSLLAAVLNHPDLYNDVAEELGQTVFASPDLEAVRQALVDSLSLEDPTALTGPELLRLLTEHPESGSRAALRETLDEVLSETTYIDAAFARPGKAPEQVRHGWHLLWHRRQRDLLRAELECARRSFADTPSDDAYARLMALRQELESVTTETAAAEAQEKAG
ncbi:MAG: DNA primase [Bdellovibrionales bacterium]